MYESNLIMLFVAANPSKDISRASKKILRKKEKMESADRSFEISVPTLNPET